MTKKKMFKVDFDTEPIKKSEPISKTVDVCVWWDIITPPYAYIVATDIAAALAKALVNLHEFAGSVTVKGEYRICGIKGISEYYQEVYV